MWIWKISTFSPDLAVTWGFCDFSLCPSECMLYECVTMNSLCIFTWRKKTKKQLPKDISRSEQRPSPTELVCNQFDMALTSMYTKVLTGWDETKRSTKCWQTNMSQYSLLPVIIESFVIIYHPVETFSVFSCERPGDAPLLQMGFCMTGLQCFSVKPGFRWYRSSNANTTSRPTLPQSRRPRGWVWTEAGSGTLMMSGRGDESLFLPESTLGIAQYSNLWQERHFSPFSYCILFSRNILTWLLC